MTQEREESLLKAEAGSPLGDVERLIGWLRERTPKPKPDAGPRAMTMTIWSIVIMVVGAVAIPVVTGVAWHMHLGNWHFRKMAPGLICGLVGSMAYAQIVSWMFGRIMQRRIGELTQQADRLRGQVRDLLLQVPPELERAAARALEETQDIESVWPALEPWTTFGAYRPGSEVAATAERAVIRLLPRLEPETASSLTKQRRWTVLAPVLQAYRPARPMLGIPLQIPDETAIILLRAAGELCEAKAALLVDRIADSEAAPAVREAARECSARLRQRNLTLEQDRLLHASDAPGRSKDALLLSTTGPGESAPESLLRPED